MKQNKPNENFQRAAFRKFNGGRLMPQMPYALSFESKVSENMDDEAQITNFIDLAIPEYKSFKEVDHDILTVLRARVFQNQIDQSVVFWCEKLLRYVEIFYPYLKQKEAKLNRSNHESVEIFCLIVNLFVGYYLNSNDLRYLNCVLKIRDLNWLIPKQNLPCRVMYEQNISKIDSLLAEIYDA